MTATPPSSTDIAIAAQGIKMQFWNGEAPHWVLNDIHLTVPRGDIQLLMGPSGSGKTTLLSIMAGLLTPTAGHVHILGQDITQLSRSHLTKFRLQHIGFIFQNANLFPALSAIENIEVALQLKGIPKQKAHLQALTLLQQFNLAHKANSLPRNLSGGQQQLIAVARALAGHPPVIMADEPTASLDSHSGRQVIDLLCQFAKNNHHTVIMVTHDDRIIDIADRVTYLEDGKLS